MYVYMCIHTRVCCFFFLVVLMHISTMYVCMYALLHICTRLHARVSSVVSRILMHMLLLLLLYTWLWLWPVLLCLFQVLVGGGGFVDGGGRGRAISGVRLLVVAVLCTRASTASEGFPLVFPAIHPGGAVVGRMDLASVQRAVQILLLFFFFFSRHRA